MATEVIDRATVDALYAAIDAVIPAPMRQEEVWDVDGLTLTGKFVAPDRWTGTVYDAAKALIERVPCLRRVELTATIGYFRVGENPRLYERKETVQLTR